MTPEDQPNQPVPDSQRLPWEREVGWLGTFFSTSVMILLSPARAFALRPAGAYYKPWLYVWLVGLVGSLFLTFMGATVGPDAGANPVEEVLAALVPEMLFSAMGLLGLAVVGWLAHHFLRSKAPTTIPLWAAWRALAYSNAAMLLIIPVGLLQMAILATSSGSDDEFSATLMLLTLPLFLLVIGYGLYLQCLALDSVYSCGKKRAFIGLLQAFFAGAVLTAVLMFIVTMLVGLGGA